MKANIFCFATLMVFLFSIPSFSLATAGEKQEGSKGLERIQPSEDGQSFMGAETGERFVVWGVNYDHDFPGRLLEDYWVEEWETVVEDFQEIKDLGANVVRIHLQVGKFMESPEEVNQENLVQLGRLVKLAEETGLYLDITGLGCYHKEDVPSWYDEMEEATRWEVQERFWQAVAEVCRESPAIFCYDLMNEPILPGKDKKETEWLAGDFGGKYFVQRISLDLGGRTRLEVAKEWVETLTSAIREVDEETMITVGAIPWAHTFPRAKPLFYSSEVGGPLDFVSVHFYPEKEKVDKALTALEVYEVGKPLVVEEIFPLKGGIEELDEFIEESSEFCDGWISFYWGKTVEEYEKEDDLKSAIMGKWLRYFREKGEEIQAP